MTDETTANPADLAALRIGEVLADKWRLERVIGHGGMATVYAASHTNNLRRVAIKFLHAELAGNADIKRRFLREGYIANKVGHPGAVAVLDDGEADGVAFLVMELLEGEALSARRDRARGAVPMADVLRVADGVLDILAAAHDQGIVHRDLKPDNVFLTESGDVKLLDFGIARLVDTSRNDLTTQNGVMMGTPAYMPPEQANGRTSEVGARSDLWSLGAILFNLLVGRHVHAAETPQEALIRAMTAHAPKLARVVPGVDERVAVIIDRALAFHPDDRWPDARTMQKAVRELIAAGYPSASPISPRAPLSPRASGGSKTPPGESPRVVSAVTKAPIVSDVGPSRGRGGRVVVVVLGIGALAAGLASLLHSRPFHGAALSDAASVAAGDASVALGGGPLGLGALGAGAASADGGDDGGDAGTDASLAMAEDGSASSLGAGDASLDADPDADLDEEDDDGGDEEDDDTVDAGRTVTPSSHVTRPPKHGVTPVHKHPKKRRKKRH